MFSTNSDAFNGELPDLFTHLEALYRKKQQFDANQKLAADPFIKWAKLYLEHNRPSEIFAVDNNHGIVLTDGQRIKLCPGQSAMGQGDMANPDNSISVSRVS